MAIKKLILTDEHIKLIENMSLTISEDFGSVDINYDNPYGNSDIIYDDIALILGDYDKRRVDGNKITYHEDIIKKYDELHRYILENFESIADLAFYNFGKPIEVGTYQTKTHFREWRKK